MGFQPSNPYPVKIPHGPNGGTYMSIMAAKLHAAEVLRNVAEAELVEQKEYLSYRIQQYEANEAGMLQQIKNLQTALDFERCPPKPVRINVKVTRKKHRRVSP